MSLFSVDEKQCRGDGVCASVCPINLIEVKPGSPVPTPVSGAEERCIKCGHCIAVCPQGALSLTDIKAEDCPPVKTDLALTAEQAEQFFRSRRSIRRYKDKTLDNEELTRLIELARYAPTGINSQLVSWTVINAREKVKNISSMVVECMRHVIADQPQMAEGYHLAERVSAWDSGKDTISRGAPVLILAHAPTEYPLAKVDCTIALSHLELAAPVFGLGCCWAGYIMLAIEQWPPLVQALELPAGHACFGVMMIGYPKYKYHRLPPRKQPGIIWR